LEIETMIKMTKCQPGVAELGALRSMALAVGVLTSASAFAQSSAAEWAVHAQNQYVVQPNVTYLAATGYDSKLDIYRRRDAQAPQPTVVFFHGGGWIRGTKEAALMSIMPWFEMGWNVVNVEYRMARVAQAPAAVEDAICALRYVFNNAKDNNVPVAGSAEMRRTFREWPRSSTGTESLISTTY
jgi:acetyl esterase/lipase